MSQLPERVRIREVGPRDGFQNEPEVIATADKVRLIELLGASGLERIEVTSFVRPDVIPQLADAEQVLEAVRCLRMSPVSVLIPNERGLERALAHRDRFQEINGFLSASETHNQQATWAAPCRSRSPGCERTFARARAEGLRCEGVISTSFGCPYEGQVAGGARARDRLRAGGCRRRGDRLRRHHRDGEPAAGAASSSPPRAERSPGSS